MKRFLYTQDGPPEQYLKESLRQLFHCESQVKAAWLVAVDDGPGTAVVVSLCIDADVENTELVGKIHKVFAPQFTRATVLDVIFIDARDKSELSGAWEPFFIRNQDC